MTMNLQYEVCVDSVEGARAARAGGAQRVELCGALSVGGITPSGGAIRATRDAVELGLHVLIRCRAGDFVFDDAEAETMERDIDLAGEWGADGVVIGALREDGQVDVDRCRRWIAGARPMRVTFHRAFDVCADPVRALEDLLDLGVDRLLTSGQAATAWEGRELIASLVARADEGLSVMPGAGVNEQTAAPLLRETGARELHFSARRQVEVPRVGGQGAAMGTDAAADRLRGVTDGDRVRAIIAAAGTAT
jgi:copper homeostasis protein